MPHGIPVERYKSESAFDILKRRHADGHLTESEYNGSFSASLKNAIDLLYEQWRDMPIAIAAVSLGGLDGLQALM